MATTAEMPLTLGTQFITRIGDLPMVSSSLTLAVAAYDKLKGSNPLVNYTLTTAERSVLFASEQVKPMVHKFEKPIELVDGLACKGLGKIEELAPSIRKTPAEILDGTVQICTETLQNGINKYEGLKTYGNEKVTAFKSYGAQKASDLIATPIGLLNGALNITESYVDYYLPPTEEEKSAENGEVKDQAVRGRVGDLSTKMKKRMYCNLMSRYNGLQNQNKEALRKLHLTLDLIQYARDNLGNPKQLLNTTVETFQTRAAHLWEELNKEGQDNEETVESRLLLLARRLTQQLVITYQTAASLTPSVPHELQEKFTTALGYTQDLYRHFNQIQGLTEFSNTLISQITQKLHFLEHVFPKSSSSSETSEVGPQDMELESFNESSIISQDSETSRDSESSDY